MPLKIFPPRPGKTPFFSVRGTYLGQYVDRSTKTGSRALALKELKRIEREIETRQFTERRAPTFASAALSYMQHGGERRFLTPLLHHFGETPLKKIDQDAVNEAALKLYPDAGPATRNRQVYTPISSVLRHAGETGGLKRPKGSAGNAATEWLWPEQAFRLIAEADRLNPVFGALLRVLCYTGARLSETLKVTWAKVRLSEGFAYIGKTKNGDPRAVHLPAVLVTALANIAPERPQDGQRVFPFAKGGHIYSLLRAAAAKAEVTLPERQSFHLLRHTYATWMRRFGGLDTKGLVATGAWRDRKSADRYEHVVVREEARKADLLPTPSGVSVEKAKEAG